MRLVVVAATGGIGAQLVEQAVAAGHEVTAVARRPERVTADVRVVTADLAHADAAAACESACKGADAVLSGLGPRSGAEAGVATHGTRNLTAAMQRTGVRRIVVVSAAPIGTVAVPGRPAPPRHDPGDGFLMRHLAAPLTKMVLREHYADLAVMEHELRDGDLDWTIVRPPRLTDRPRTGAYRTAYGRNLLRGVTIPRADVAHYMLRALDEPASVRQIVGIAS